jgi:hypothetical protein
MTALAQSGHGARMTAFDQSGHSILTADRWITGQGHGAGSDRVPEYLLPIGRCPPSKILPSNDIFRLWILVASKVPICLNGTKQPVATPNVSRFASAWRHPNTNDAEFSAGCSASVLFLVAQNRSGKETISNAMQRAERIFDEPIPTKGSKP